MTLKRDARAIADRGVDFFDEFVRNGTPWFDFQMSGLFCVEYACRHGASVVYLAGMCGYDGKHDYWHTDVPEKNGDLTKRVVEPLTNKMAAKYPSVEFVSLGPTRYTVEADNWSTL